MVNSNSTVPVVVEMGGIGVVAHVGLHLLGSFADRLGVGDSLSTAIAPRGETAGDDFAQMLAAARQGEPRAAEVLANAATALAAAGTVLSVPLAELCRLRHSMLSELGTGAT